MVGPIQDDSEQDTKKSYTRRGGTRAWSDDEDVLLLEFVSFQIFKIFDAFLTLSFPFLSDNITISKGETIKQKS